MNFNQISWLWKGKRGKFLSCQWQTANGRSADSSVWTVAALHLTTSLLHVDISISKNNSIKQQNSKHFWNLKKTWNPFNWPIKWSHFREIFNNQKLLECSTTLLFGPSRLDEAFVRKFTKMRFGGARHLAPSRHFNGRLRSNASTDRVGPKKLSIDHLKTNLTIQNLIELNLKWSSYSNFIGGSAKVVDLKVPTEWTRFYQIGGRVTAFRGGQQCRPMGR